MDPGWNIRIRDKHPGSATLLIGLIIEINRKKPKNLNLRHAVKEAGCPL
jgi:hypothetical protein